MVRPVAGDLPEQVKNNQSVNMAAGNGGQKMSQYPWFTVYDKSLMELLIFNAVKQIVDASYFGQLRIGFHFLKVCRHIL